MKNEKAYIFDQRIDRISIDELMRKIEKILQKKNTSKISITTQKQYLFFAMNIHNLIELKKDPVFKERYDDAENIFADGVPLTWIARFFKQPSLSRVSGTDLVEKIFACRESKIFIIGGNQKIFTKLKKRYSKTVVGFYRPPYGEKWGNYADKKIIEAINSSGSNIILSAVGALKQEKWLIKNISKTNACIGIGVGSALEILTGEKKRAPCLMKNNGLEWLWRLALEPRRLWKRYLSDAIYVVFLILLETISFKRK